MKTLAFTLLTCMVMSISCNSNTRNEISDVEEAVEIMRKTMLNPDQQIFEKLTSPNLSYGHSNGLVEDQKTCIESMVSGKYKFLTLDISDQTVHINGDVALVRHNFMAKTHNAGREPAKVKLGVLQIWKINQRQWRLIARQAYKI